MKGPCSQNKNGGCCCLDRKVDEFTSIYLISADRHLLHRSEA